MATASVVTDQSSAIFPPGWLRTATLPLHTTQAFPAWRPAASGPNSEELQLLCDKGGSCVNTCITLQSIYIYIIIIIYYYYLLLLLIIIIIIYYYYYYYYFIIIIAIVITIIITIIIIIVVVIIVVVIISSICMWLRLYCITLRCIVLPYIPLHFVRFYCILL